MKLNQFQEWGRGVFLWMFLALLVLCKFWNFLIPKETLFWGNDFIELAGMREFFYHQLQKGSFYLWDYLITTGMPYQIADSGVFYPVDLIIGFFSKAYFEPYRLTLFHVIHFWLTGVFTYLYTRQLGLSRTPALFSSISFMLGGFMLGHGGHRNMIQTIAWFPLGLYFLDKALLQRQVIWASAAGFVLAFSFLAGHAHIFYYLLLFLLMYYCFRIYLGIQKRSFKLIYQDTFYFLITGLFLLGISALQLFPALGDSLKTQQATLPYGWKIQDSFPIFNLIHFLFPAYSQWSTWAAGEHYSYIGILPLILSIWAIIRLKDARTRFFGLVGLFSLLMALGDFTPVYEFFYNNLPGLKLFRVPARINCLMVFSLSILAGIGCHHFLLPDSNPVPPKAWKSLKGIHYLFGGGGIIIAIYLAVWLLTERRESVQTISDVWRLLSGNFILFLVFMSTSYLILLGRIKWGANTLIKIFMILLLSLDLVQESYPGSKLAPTPQSAKEVIKTIKKDPDLFRINNREGVLPGLLRYREKIFTYDSDSAPGYAARLIPDESLTLILFSYKNPMLLDLLNVKYYIGSQSKMNNGLEIIRIGENFGNKELPLEHPTKISRLAFTTFLTNSQSIPQGTTVAQVNMITIDGGQQTIPIRAGLETAEWAIDRPGLKCLHQRAKIEESWKMGKEGYQGHNYSFSVDLPNPIEVGQIDLQYLPGQGNLIIKKMVVNSQEIEGFLKKRFQLIAPNIYKNPSWLPRVFMIGKAKAISDTNELLEQLDQLDPREAVLVSKLPQRYHEPLTPSFSVNEAKINYYTPDHIKIDTKTEADKFLVLSDTFNPFWKATIDQSPSPILKVNYGLRGLYVPKGDHRIEFSFHFYPFYYGLAITCLSLFVFFFLVAATIRRRYRKGAEHSIELKG